MPGGPGTRAQAPSTSFLPGCCHQWCRDPAALQAHGPCRLPLPVHWRLAYHSNQGGVSSCRRGPQPSVLWQQPQPPPPSCLWQRLCFIHEAQEGLPAIAAAPMQPASAPQLPPEPTTSRTMAPTMASGGPALPSGVGTLLEPSRPTGTQPLTTLEFLSPFTSYSAGAHPAILGALSLPPRLPSGPLTPRPASLPLTLVPVLEGTSPCHWASGQPPLLHPTGSKASRAVCPRCFCLAVSLALLSLFPALPPWAQQGTEDLGQQVTSSGLLASSGVGETGQVCSHSKRPGVAWWWREQSRDSGGSQPPSFPDWVVHGCRGARRCSGGTEGAGQRRSVVGGCGWIQETSKENFKGCHLR